MADQPNTPAGQGPNAGRITAMLQDLAAQRADSSQQNPPAAPAPAVRPQTAPPPVSRPISPTVATAVPSNLPTPSRPVLTSPVPPPGITVPARPTTPPPAPRETPVPVVPVIVRPPVPPPPAAPLPPRPVTPAPAASSQISTEMRTMSADIGSIKVGQAPSGIKRTSPAEPALPTLPASPRTPQLPTAPASPVFPSPQQTPAPLIIIPRSSGGGTFRKVFFGVLGVIVLVIIIYSLVSIFGSGDKIPEVSSTPAPVTETTIAVGVKTLNAYLGNPAHTTTLNGQSTARDDFKNDLVSVQPGTKLAVSLAVKQNGSQVSPQTFISYMFDNPPADLLSSLGTDWAVFAFGQTEQYDSTGQPATATGAETRLVLIVEITDASRVNQAMQFWEGSGLASSSAVFFGYDLTKRIVPAFSSGDYRSIPVRYWNFPYADRSIDYGIITASNNKNYLILSGSRESIFFAVDQLMQ